MAERQRETYEEEAEAPFDPKFPDPRVTEWGPQADYQAGPAGLCWHNARQLAGSAPDKFLYAEGLAYNGGEWSGHGWVVRKSDGEVIECTEATAPRPGTEVSAWRSPTSKRSSTADNPWTGVCRERWRTECPDGSVRSEAPGITAILAEEVHVQKLDMWQFGRELDSWLDRGMYRP